MRRIALFFLLILMVFIIGCSPSQKLAEPKIGSQNESIEDDIWQRIIEKHGQIIEFIMASNSDNHSKSITILLEDDISYSSLGDYFKSITNICNNYALAEGITIARLNISVLQDDNPVFLFSTNDFKSGYLIDSRNGDHKTIILKTIDDLADIFPAMKFAEAQSNLPEDIVRIYNEVMDKLYAQPDVPEDVLFEEIAPDYNMTPYELKAFMTHYMDAMYGGKYTPLPDDFGFTYIEAPEAIYTTMGKENGLMDTAMFATGEIVEFNTVDRFNYFILQNDYGKLLIAQDDIFGKIGNTERWNDLNNGDVVTVYFVYLGWIDEEIFIGGNGIYFTCLYENEQLKDHKEWIQKWYWDYVLNK